MPQDAPQSTTIRLSFTWLLIILVGMILFGVLGGLLGQRLFAVPTAFPSDTQQLVTTVQQVTVSPNKQRSTVADTVGKSVVTLIQQGATPKALGLGTIVTNDGYIVTPRNIIPTGVDQMAVVDSNGLVSAVQMIGTDTVYGLTYFKISSGVGVPVELVTDETPVGSLLTSVSRSPESGAPIVGSFELQEYITPPADASLVGGSVASAWQRLSRGQYSAVSAPGTPVATDEGKIAGLTLSSEYGLAMRALDVKESLDRVISGKREADVLGTVGISVRYSFVKLPATGVAQFAPVITAVTPGSPAAIAGLKSQDLILKVGSEQVKWEKNLVTQIPALPFEVTVSHQGVERTVSLTPATP